MNSKEDILNNGELEGLKSYTIFKRKTPGFKRYNCENLKVIDKWYLKICKNNSSKINCRYWFSIVGFLKDGTLIQSSPIIEIESPRILITENSRYKLEVNSDLRKYVPHLDFSREELNKFLNGFPKDWMNIFRIELEKIYGKNLYNTEDLIKVEMNREMDKLYENLEKSKEREKERERDMKVKRDYKDNSKIKGDNSLINKDNSTFKRDNSKIKGDNSTVKRDSSLIKGSSVKGDNKDNSLIMGNSSILKENSLIKVDSSLKESSNSLIKGDSIKKDEININKNNNNNNLIQDFIDFNKEKPKFENKKSSKRNKTPFNDNKDSLENVLDELLVAQKEIDGILLKDNQKKKPNEVEWLPKSKLSKSKGGDLSKENLSKSYEDGKDKEEVKKSSKSKGGDLSKSDKGSSRDSISNKDKCKDPLVKDHFNNTPTLQDPTLSNPHNTLTSQDPTPPSSQFPFLSNLNDVEGIFEDILRETSLKKTNEKKGKNMEKDKNVIEKNKNVMESKDNKDNKEYKKDIKDIDIMEIMDNIGEGLIKDLDKEIIKEEDKDKDVKEEDGNKEGPKNVKDLIEPKDITKHPFNHPLNDPPKHLFDLDFIPDLSFHSLDLDSSKIFLSKKENLSKENKSLELSPQKRQKEEEEEIVRSYIKEIDEEKEKEFVFEKRRKLERKGENEDIKVIKGKEEDSKEGIKGKEDIKVDKGKEDIKEEDIKQEVKKDTNKDTTKKVKKEKVKIDKFEKARESIKKREEKMKEEKGKKEKGDIKVNTKDKEDTKDIKDNKDKEDIKVNKNIKDIKDNKDKEDTKVNTKEDKDKDIKKVKTPDKPISLKKEEVKKKETPLKKPKKEIPLKKENKKKDDDNNNDNNDKIPLENLGEEDLVPSSQISVSSVKSNKKGKRKAITMPKDFRMISRRLKEEEAVKKFKSKK